MRIFKGFIIIIIIIIIIVRIMWIQPRTPV